MSIAPISGAWRVAVASGCELGERPVWDEASNTVLWSDVTAGLVHRSAVSASGPWPDETFPIGPGLGTVSLRRDGGWIVTSGHSFSFHDAQGRVDRDPVDVAMPAGARFNDGVCDPGGRLLTGTTSGDDRHPNGVLWSFDGSGPPRVLLDRLTESNGLGWSPDGTVLYYVDSVEPVIRRYGYDLDTGSLTQRLTDLAVTGSLPIVPDGLVVDEAGTVWVALWQGGALRAYDPAGALLAEYSVPVAGTTCPAFVGPDLDVLVMATGWEGLSAEEREDQPWAGHLLVMDAPVRGRPPFRFAGRA